MKMNSSMAMKSSLTIMFEAPFWIGLYERFDNDTYEVCKITFGAEPKDYEIYEFMIKNWDKLKFSPPIKSQIVQDRGIGTKAQQALKLQHEQCKLERKIKSREQREAEKDRQYTLRQEKKKAKHRGR